LSLVGKTAVVTGGLGGIGAACVEGLAEHGATVVACDVHTDGPAYPDRTVTYAQLDVRDPGAWQRVFAEEPIASSGVDILVNAAGIGGAGALHEVTLEEWNDVIAVNETGVMLGTQRVLESAARHGRGASIVNISSIWGTTATAGFAAYHASKGSVALITRNTAVTYAQAGVRANAVHPGLIDTPMSRGNSEEFNEAIIARTPLARRGTPAEVAACVLFLAGDGASFVTGASLYVDGGFSAL